MAKTKRKLPSKLKKGEGLILVVDDEPIMRKIAVNVLENCGYEVMSADDGDQAIEIFKKHHSNIRAVLLDLLMPNKSGKEIFLEMQTIQPDVNAILITGAKKDKRVKEVLQLGMKGYIEKPYTFPQLSHEVYNVLYKKKQKNDRKETTNDEHF